MARSGDRRERSNPRGGRLPVLPTGNRPHGFAPASTEDAERSGLPAWGPVLRRRRGRRTQPTGRVVVRSAGRVDEAGRSLDWFLGGRRDRVISSSGAVANDGLEQERAREGRKGGLTARQPGHMQAEEAQ